ncbi:MAG: hypothetical protein MUO62_01595 [Anaerolineales bacterium]|nr:hypothetical protein [Anaerolineales bacterium]
MSKTINHKDAEKQVFRLATFDDGIWEIYLGLFFTLMGALVLSKFLRDYPISWEESVNAG